MMTRFIFTLLGLLILNACASISSPEDARGIANASLPKMPIEWTMAREKVGEVEVGWIEKIGDPLLSELVVEAQTTNRDLQAAAAAVSQSQAFAAQARSALFPALDGTITKGRSGVIDLPSSDFYNLGLQLGWEADVWGRVRSAKRAAAFSAFSAEADYIFTQYSIAAAVAQSYFLVIEAGLQTEVSRKSLTALQETDLIVTAKYELGAVSALDVALSRSDLANARASIAEVEGSRRNAIRALEVLLGRYPSAELTLRQTLPSIPSAPPPGLPSTLLERRPDIIAAELNVASAFNNVKSARAARLPTISLTSSIEGSSTDLSDILDPGNVMWQLASNLLAPLFDGGLRKAQVDEANAGQQQAIAAYAQTALNAFRDVENSLDQGAVLLERVTALREAASEANKALEISQLRYQEGETDLLDVLTIQNNTFAADSALVSAERAQLDEWINLNLALGGGWQ